MGMNKRCKYSAEWSDVIPQINQKQYYQLNNDLAYLNKKGNNIFCFLLLVRLEGLEPPYLTASDPKSDVSTNFTTGAFQI